MGHKIEWEKSGLDAACDAMIAQGLRSEEVATKLGVCRSVFWRRMKKLGKHMLPHVRGRKPGYKHSSAAKENISCRLRQFHSQKNSASC